MCMLSDRKLYHRTLPSCRSDRMDVLAAHSVREQTCGDAWLNVHWMASALSGRMEGFSWTGMVGRTWASMGDAKVAKVCTGRTWAYVQA